MRIRSERPDFTVIAARQQSELGESGLLRLLDSGHAWDLAPTLKAGGAVIFPHATLAVCGHQIAAAVHACLNSGAARVLALGVLHALTPELEAARVRVAEGGDPAEEPSWGIQGPGIAGRDDWRTEFSLSHFQRLWKQEVQRRGTAAPELVVRYPYLAGGKPEWMPGIHELETLAQDSVVVATIDPFHHGIGYGDPSDRALAPETGGLDLARQRILEGMALLQAGDYAGFNRHCVQNRSDGRDVGQVLFHLRGALQPQLYDLIADDQTANYHAPPPTWVAGALIGLTPVPKF